jgi:cyclophilin family peptidyl-prolyl cis-trans isomerase
MKLTTVWPEFRRAFICLYLPISLTACGGGGGASGGSDPPNNLPPIAAAKVTGEAVLNASTVFDTTGSSDPEGRALTVSWDYGDGRTGSLNSHAYASIGSFTATYTVRDDKGATASKVVQVNVAKCSADGTRASGLSPYPTVCMQTSKGEMVLEVYPTQAPLTVVNFLKYVDDGFYTGTLFHRVIKGFVAQAGGFSSGVVAKAPTYPPITLESKNGLLNWQYTLAMARTNVANSATSQFFVNLADNPALNYSPSQAIPNGYAVFGQVISGTAVIDAIGGVATGNQNGSADVPVEEVSIKSVVRLP